MIDSGLREHLPIGVSPQAALAGAWMSRQSSRKGWSGEEQRRAFRFELLTETVFDAAQGEFQVGDNQFVWAAADDRDQEDKAAEVGKGVALVRELKRFADFSRRRHEVAMVRRWTVGATRLAEEWRAGSQLAKRRAPGRRHPEERPPRPESGGFSRKGYPRRCGW